MSSPAPPTLDLEAYAAITVALADGALPRAIVLAERGLGEAEWAAIDERWQAELSGALEEEHEGVPPLVAAYAEAFERARAARRRVKEILPLERFADATREIQLRGDPLAALAHLGIALGDYLAANEHWTPRILAEPALATIFRGRLVR